MKTATNTDAPVTDNPNLTELSSRLVRLCDGRPGLRGGLSTEIREVEPNSGQPVIEFIASDETLDRYDEIIVAGGWRLDTYRRNPVFQNAHQYGDILFTLGRSLEIGVRGDRLYQRVEFATGINPVARIAYGLYRGHFLNAVSVGFVPLRWENGGPTDGFRRRYLEQELLEVSAVGIPANPNALQLALRAGAIERADLRAFRDLLKELIQKQFGSRLVGGRTSASGADANEARWLRLARDLSDLLCR